MCVVLEFEKLVEPYKSYEKNERTDEETDEEHLDNFYSFAALNNLSDPNRSFDL